MALDPYLQSLVDKAARLPSMRSVPLQAVRSSDVRRLSTGLPLAEVGSVQDQHFDGPRGPVRIRVYRPAVEEPSAPLPVTVFFHGSGFVICSIESHDEMCRHLCRGSATIVVSVDYALAPEHPFPAAPDDCLSAVRWVALHAGQFGGDPARLALAGDSAGANLATVTAQRLRDDGLGPALRAQLLWYPVTDYYSAHHRSYEERGVGCGLSADDMVFFWDHYLPDRGLADHPWASPLRAPVLSGLPPALIVTAEYDVLRDEGEAYARRLREAGVPTAERRYADVNHGFINWVGRVASADDAMAWSCGWLCEALA